MRFKATTRYKLQAIIPSSLVYIVGLKYLLFRQYLNMAQCSVYHSTHNCIILIILNIIMIKLIKATAQIVS